MRAKLSELGTVITGNTPSKQESKYWASSDIPFIKPDAINQDGIQELQTANEYISEAARSKARIVGKSVVLVTCIGTIGKICLTGKECAFNQQINAIIPNDRVLPEYLAYCLYYNRPKLIELANAPVVPIINKRQFEDFSVNIEENVEQQGSIVTILKKVDRLIHYRQQQLQKLDDLVKARFVELFGDPISNPMKWDTYQLEECLEQIDNGKSFICSDKPRTGDTPAILKLSAATYGDYRPNENKALLDESLFVESAEVHAGDLLFTRKNTPELVGTAAYVRNTPSKLMMPDLIFRLVPNEKVNAVFLWQLINCKEFRPVIQAISGGSAKSMSNISKERLGKIKVICPPRELQDSLIPFVEQTGKSKAVIQKALDETRLLFDSLMQEYFG